MVSGGTATSSALLKRCALLQITHHRTDHRGIRDASRPPAYMYRAVEMADDREAWRDSSSDRAGVLGWAGGQYCGPTVNSQLVLAQPSYHVVKESELEH